jgi:UDP-glucose 6-dehydrogenase
LKRISIFGLGKVGLAAAVCLAKKGHTVTGIDWAADKLETIRSKAKPRCQ